MRNLLLVALLGTVTCLPAAADRFDFRMPMDQRQSGIFYVTATLATDIETDFLVDTGSSYVTVTSRVFARLRHQDGTHYARVIHGAMANGRSQKVHIYRIARLALAQDCVLHDIEVAVMPGSSQNILGLNALRQFAPFAMEMSPPSLVLSGCAGAATGVASTSVQPQ